MSFRNIIKQFYNTAKIIQYFQVHRYNDEEQKQ